MGDLEGSWRGLGGVLEGALEVSWRYLGGVLEGSWRGSWRGLGGCLGELLEGVLEGSWRGSWRGLGWVLEGTWRCLSDHTSRRSSIMLCEIFVLRSENITRMRLYLTSAKSYSLNITLYMFLRDRPAAMQRVANG